MKQDYTDISIVQDKSGSMNPVRDVTIKGFNDFIAEQKKIAGKCLVTMMQFDTDFLMIYNGEDIQNIKPLTHETYTPGGNTALLDAVAKTIINTGQRLEAMQETERPGKVVVVIITDGEENSSTEFAGAEGRGKLFEMIRHQIDVYSWSFLFLGANQDAIQSGESIGIAPANAMSFAANNEGTGMVFEAVSENIAQYRMCSAIPEAQQALSFKKSQRLAQREAGASSDALNNQKSTD